jgi:hypothetical protein
VEQLDHDSKIYEEISNKLILNYELAEALVPAKLRKEFRNKIIPRNYIRNLLPLVVKCKKLQNTSLQEQIKFIFAVRIGMGGFGLRCEACGRLPEEIFAEMVRDLFSDTQYSQGN